MGYKTNPSLPILDVPRDKRSLDDVVDRILGMYCLGACAYGFPPDKAYVWLENQSKESFLTSAEKNFLENGTGKTVQFMNQIEGLFALTWSVSLVGNLDFKELCPDDFVHIFPDLKSNESAQQLRLDAELRPEIEMLQACDLSYCLHWAIRDSAIRGMKHESDVPAYVIVERRRALEWLVYGGAWDEISLDT